MPKVVSTLKKPATVPAAAATTPPPRRPRIRVPPPGPNGRAVLAKDQKYLAPSYTRCYPLVVKQAEGMYVEDVDGNSYLDFTAGIAVCATGHAHKAVVRAIQEQAAKFLHMAGTDFYYALQSDLAELLARITPGTFDKRVFFTNSGAETTEAAFKLARYFTRRPRMLAFTGGFHGRTMGALSLSASKTIQKQGFAPLVPEVTHVPYAYCYRCPFNLTHPSCELACVDYIEETVLHKQIPPEEVAAIIVEPIQGEGGYVVPPPGYFEKLGALAKKHGMLLIVDEIQSGLGRTGKMFAIQHWDVVPDIVCIAKGIASGLPLGAMVSRADLHTWGPGAHANTFGGNPVACAAALTTIGLIERELMANAAKSGAAFKAGLDDLSERYDVIGDVRGMGLMLGIEIVDSKRTRGKAAALRNEIVDRCFEKGLLIIGCGENTIRFCPPLILTESDVAVGMAILDEALEEVTAARPA
ncbi:MAG: acetyl ornithine aminotransferase family protein [Planctomycetes bacterium]|nr:acetyl ornithine aminotransferase family protein [Planctomycetota bacterium]